ncbi:hypothetical protein PtA15_5A73 [Puccinia triticina]|uniref:Cyanovirin-N domain-containing protein n=1 Tax=Puccinia triticina TaxID=208348 RepID=A0ABY7CH16_9BASI|nr:uncharacterized protein PtA15_5A73 [Puccinia triticina]WAQ84503.1 hypothetical protein PtA15_5A73 [Puccinia triticina]
MQSFALLSVCVLLLIQSQAVYCAFKCNNNAGPHAGMKNGFCGRTKLESESTERPADYKIYSADLSIGNGWLTCAGVNGEGHDFEERWCCDLNGDGYEINHIGIKRSFVERHCYTRGTFPKPPAPSHHN